METLKRTASPWKATPSDPTEGYHVWWITGNTEAHNGERDICSIPGGGTVSEGDARLISAAPDFHAAAVKLLAAFDELQSVTTAERIITGRSDADLRKASNEAVAELRAAIAKAEGQS